MNRTLIPVTANYVYRDLGILGDDCSWSIWKKGSFISGPLVFKQTRGHRGRDRMIYNYNYLCNQCLSSLKFWVRIPLMEKCTRYNIMWWHWSVTRQIGGSLLFPPPIKLTATI